MSKDPYGFLNNMKADDLHLGRIRTFRPVVDVVKADGMGICPECHGRTGSFNGPRFTKCEPCLAKGSIKKLITCRRIETTVVSLARIRLRYVGGKFYLINDDHISSFGELMSACPSIGGNFGSPFQKVYLKQFLRNNGILPAYLCFDRMRRAIKNLYSPLWSKNPEFPHSYVVPAGYAGRNRYAICSRIPDFDEHTLLGSGEILSASSLNQALFNYLKGSKAQIREQDLAISKIRHSSAECSGYTYFDGCAFHGMTTPTVARPRAQELDRLILGTDLDETDKILDRNGEAWNDTTGWQTAPSG